MTFVAVIDADKHKFMWSRAILSLAGIADHIKFIVSAESLSLSAVNHTKTTHAEIIFQKPFFYEYSADFTDITHEGYDEDSVDIGLSSYSFLVNSRNLAILFKNMDVSDLEYICFKANWHRSAPAATRFKLLVEIRTTKLIIKKYQTSYQPVVRNKLTVSTIYKLQLLLQQNRDESEPEPEDPVRFIMIEQLIPKQFLETLPSTTEDFKIEVTGSKILFTGYTKQVMKDRDYLKQPMSVTITLSLDELSHTNLIVEDDGERSPARNSINFGLKDFRNFINLAASFTHTSGVSGAGDGNDEYVNLASIGGTGDAHLNVYYKRPGDPILFELRTYPHVQIEYVQITSDDSLREVGTSRRSDGLELHSHVIHKVRREAILSESVVFSQPRGPPNRRSVAAPVAARNLGAKSGSATRSFTRSPLASHSPMALAESYEDIVTYGDRQESPYSGPLAKKQRVQDDDATDYSHSDEDGEWNGRPQTEDAALGPTQTGGKPKSILD